MTSLSARERAMRALTEALKTHQPNILLDQQGYVVDVSANLLLPLNDAIQKAFLAGAGQELKGKMRAPFSSSALAVNAFGPWADSPGDLELAGMVGFTNLQFEKVCATGLRGESPHLDVIAGTDVEVIAVESKCLEYFSPTPALFADSYSTIKDYRAVSRWFRHVSAPSSSYRHLDVAQLVKHYLGLAREYAGKSVTLLYLYWEPENWNEVPECVRHRTELQDFAYSVVGDDIRFASLSYPELWTRWKADFNSQARIQAHVETLRARYAAHI